MVRLSAYYDFEPTGRPAWVPVAFPEGDNMQVPDKSGVYRFSCQRGGDSQILFAGTAPSNYGLTLRACYGHHVLTRGDTTGELHGLYVTANLDFEHCQCNEKEAKEQKYFLVSNFKPHYNVVIKLKIGENSTNNPFDN